MFRFFEAWFSWLREDPASFLVFTALRTAVVLIALTLHECAHGYVALRCGDPTAKARGRLSVNPLKHLDPIGTLCMFALGFGWAKPVPINPAYFRKPRRDYLLVSVAGIATNLALFLLSSVAVVALNGVLWQETFLELWGARTFLPPDGAVCSYLMSGAKELVFMDGSTEAIETFMRVPWLQYVQRFFLMLGSVNLGLAVFNALPLPPLDGFHLLNEGLLNGRLSGDPRIFQFCHLALLLLCFMTDIISNIMGVVMDAVQNGVIGALLALFGG